MKKETRLFKYDELAERLKQAMEDRDGAVIQLTAVSVGDDYDCQLFHAGGDAQVISMTVDHVSAMLDELDGLPRKVFVKLLRKALRRKLRSKLRNSKCRMHNA